MLQVVVGLLFQGKVLKGRQGGELWPDVVIGSAKQVDHQLQLIDLGFSRQEGFVGEQLTENATSRPHVNCSCLGARIQQKLRGSIPKSNHLQIEHLMSAFLRQKLISMSGHGSIVKLPWVSLA